MFYSQSFAHLRVSLQNFVLQIILDNADSSNAITLEMVDSLIRVLKQADYDSAVRVIVITGAGKAFCAGGDVKAMLSKTGLFAGESNELRVQYIKGIQQIPRCLEELSKPVIAAVNGAAIGAGCDLALMCDIRIGTTLSRFGETFVKLGLVPGDGGSFFLQRVVGFAKAMELSLTAEILNGEDCLKWGLLNRLVPEEELMPEALAWAQKIAEHPPIAIQMTKKAVKLAYSRDLNHVLELAAAYQGIAQRTEDHFTAVVAMRDKKSATYKGI